MIATHKEQADEETAAAQSADKDEHDQGAGNRRDAVQGEENDTPALEWVIACIGMFLVAAVLGFLVYKAFTRKPVPPQITIRTVAIVPMQNGYLVQFDTVNHGESTAAGVIIEGELRRGTEVVESSHTTVDYLPPNSGRSGGLFFTRDPRQFEFQARALGYQEP